ncbi:MAG: hypothetical protein JWO06_3950 [Bacteroidota bacterium]|nr:hypothetical protein [Bacteroidota bacterium]
MHFSMVYNATYTKLRPDAAITHVESPPTLIKT